MIKKNPLLFTHIFKVNPKYAVSYYYDKFRDPHRRYQVDKRKKGDRFQLSKQAKKSMNNCFAWLQIISNKKRVYSKKEKKSFTFQLSFIDLTLPTVQKHSDEYIKKHMLSPFLKWMQRSWSCNSYIWKAEVQNEGNLHFHITTNKFIHWKSIRTKWNRILSAHGYCKVFQDGTNDKGNAATRIKAVINPKQISNYVANYCTKKDTFKTNKHFKNREDKFHVSGSCELNGHFYQKENYRQIVCSDGTVREYKRFVHGRLWNASYNLNVPPVWFSNDHEPYKEMIDLVSNPEVCDTLVMDFSAVHIFKSDFFRLLPPDVKRVFKEAREQLISDDVPQKSITIESIY
jgi:hypothetical protein